jgi:hypothetical protein
VSAYLRAMRRVDLAGDGAWQPQSPAALRRIASHRTAIDGAAKPDDSSSLAMAS